MNSLFTVHGRPYGSLGGQLCNSSAYTRADLCRGMDGIIEEARAHGQKHGHSLPLWRRNLRKRPCGFLPIDGAPEGSQCGRNGAYTHLCRTYAREDNLLYIPESRMNAINGRYLLSAMENFGLTGIHCFAVDEAFGPGGKLTEDALAFRDTMLALGHMKPLTARNLFCLEASEGELTEEGAFIPRRRRNGDETDTGLWVAADVSVVHAKVF